MDGVTGTLKFVKFSKKTPEGKYSQVLVITTDFDIPLQTLYKIMHKRWDKENSTFIKLNKGCFVGNGVVIPFLHYRLRID